MTPIITLIARSRKYLDSAALLANRQTTFMCPQIGPFSEERSNLIE